MAVSKIPYGGVVYINKTYTYGQSALSSWGNALVNDTTVPTSRTLIVNLYDGGSHILMGIIHSSRLYASFILVDYQSTLKQYTMANGVETIRTYSFTTS